MQARQKATPCERSIATRFAKCFAEMTRDIPEDKMEKQSEMLERLKSESI